MINKTLKIGKTTCNLPNLADRLTFITPPHSAL